jgi:hypothetical protein
MAVSPFALNCLLPVQLFSIKWAANRSLPRAPRDLHPAKWSLQACLLSLSCKGTQVGLCAAVERGASQGARSGSTGPTWVSFQSFSSFVFYLSSPTQSGRYPDKRVTGLPFTARVQRGPSEAARCASKKGNRLPATFSSAHPSTPSPPSLCAAPRPWLVQAPSQPPTDVGGTLQQTPSCAPHLF